MAGSSQPFAAHRYLPLGEADLQKMLAALGVSSVDELFASVPEAVLLDRPLDLPGPLSDQELRTYFGEIAAMNQGAGDGLATFLGAGAYRHDTPSVADYMAQRGEFLTVYTPYQPEVSQGTLQAIFEFQTFISILTGLPVANASMYDGASAFAEAVMMADRLQKRRSKVILSRAIHPHYRETFRTYSQYLDLDVVEIGWDASGQTDLDALAAELDDNTACVALQSPNYFGVVESWERVSGPAQEAGALTIGVVTEALSMALLRSPGDGGCDIACGEGQSFGLPVSYGGPYLGFLSAKDRFKRAMPGRLAGETVDSDGRRAWVLTLSTREQHIRREKATSNICTNQALCALLATVYLALHGKTGLRRLAELNLQRSAALKRRLSGLGAGLSSTFEAPSFNEFALRAPGGSGEAYLARLAEEGVLGGVALGPDYPELEDSFLVAVTEANPPAELDRYAAAVERLEES